MASLESLEKLVLDLAASQERQFEAVNKRFDRIDTRLGRIEKEMGGFRRLLVAPWMSYTVWTERITDLQARDADREEFIQKLVQRIEDLEKRGAA